MQYGSTLCTTNCIDHEDKNTDWRVHPPQPCFVKHGLELVENQWGSKSYPFFGTGNVNPIGGLRGAVKRIGSYGSSVDVWLEPGEFDEIGSLRIDKPMILMKWRDRKGVVTIK